MFEVGDLVKGKENSPYSITNKGMTKGIVKAVNDHAIEVKILKHKSGDEGCFWVDSQFFEKIGHADKFDSAVFLELMKESEEKAVEYLSNADLSGSQGLLDAINYLEANFERTEEGYIVYKTFGAYNNPPTRWKIEKGSIIEETVNPDRTDACGCGINVATLEWVKNDNRAVKPIYKLLIKFGWLAGVVVPFGTNGKIRCSRAQILGVVTESEGFVNG